MSTQHTVTGARYGVYDSPVQAVKVNTAGAVVLSILKNDSGSLPVRTGSGLAAGVYMLANTNECHIAVGGSTIAAAATHPILAIGERLLILDEGSYVAVIGIGADATDAGLLSITPVV